MDPVAGNPCPFLRALAREGAISATREPLATVADVITDAVGEPLEARRIRRTIYAIAMIGNGLSPRQLLRSLRLGLRAAELRGGPLDKRGAGSRIIDQHGAIEPAQLDRLDQFAADFVERGTDRAERGLGAAQLTRMMDANFARAEGARRRIDRKLMDGEWPVLLRVLGKPSEAGPYLSLAEVRTLFLEQQLPARIVARIRAHVGSRPAASART